MHTFRFRNNDTIPALGLGTWKSATGKVYEAVKTALDIGYKHIDCAPIYGNETEIGQAFGESFSSGILKREEIFITSKLWCNAHAPEMVQPALEKTLADLQLEYLDLFLIHWPVHFVPEVVFPSSTDQFIPYKELPIAQTWEAMEDLVAQGLVRHIGVSNFSIKKLQELSENSQIAPEMNQIEMHPYLQQPKMIEFCNTNDILLTAYSPLGSPDRPADLKAADEPLLLEEPVVQKIAEAHNVSTAQVLINWAVNRGTVVIPKSVTPSRIQQNLEAADLNLSEEEYREIDTIDRHRRYVTGEFWAPEGSPYTIANIWDE
ncbi:MULTISPECIES: aldo/keto reductase [Desulfosediminicola]|uniref:aldo/keto reductase n=1 Tax=Desulfosediminicola TaxID=2886823 RepID=UPI0010AD325D|nr:aldo/keto reductase [Desulfosediminicola ganghwensis]